MNVIKSKSIICFYIFYLLFFFDQLAFAELLTYKNAIKDSINSSAGLRVKIEDVRIANAQYRGSFAELYPSITINGRTERYENLDNRNNQILDTIGNEVVGGNQTAWKSSLSLSGQYYFSHWYKKRYEVQYYEKMRDVNVHECESTAKKMIKDVTDIFGGITEGKIKLKYGIEILSRLCIIADIKGQAFKLGQYSYEDVLKAQSDAVSMEKEIVKIRKELKEYLARLGIYTGNSYTEKTDIAYLTPQGWFPVSDEKKVILSTPEYLARRRELEAARSREKAAANNFWPDISLYGRYDLYNATSDFNKTYNDVRPVGYSAGLLISIPLFDGGVRKWERQRNIHEIRKQEESAWAAFAEKNKDIKTLQAGLTELNKTYNHFRKLNQQYEKLTAIAQKAHFLGDRSNLDIMDLEKDALGVERDFKIAANTLAVYEKQLMLELDYKQFMREHDGDWSCKY
ncbi:MAG: TolC family protein [Smithella sp.]